MQELTPLKGESTKGAFIYTRIEAELLHKIDEIKVKKGFKNRSQTIRRIINWVFENRIQESVDKKKEVKTESTTKDEFIYTRIENDLLQKIDDLKTKKEFTNRSQTIRRIINVAFENGIHEA